MDISKLLALIAGALALLALIPRTAGYPLVAVAALLLAIAFLIGDRRT